MTPEQFIAKWSGSTLSERSGSQQHFVDLCGLLGVDTPAEADPHGSWYTFDKGASKTDGSDGWADVWKRGHFAWEYKGKHKDLGAALRQVQQYALALESPPLLVTCDFDTIAITTQFTNTVTERHAIALADLAEARNLDKLRWLFADPERLRPGVTRPPISPESCGWPTPDCACISRHPSEI